MKKIRNSNKQRVKTAKGRKIASKLWLERQLNDVYVKQAKAEGYRSRAAYKIIEMDEKFHFLKHGKKVLDLGAAPGGWSQVASAKGCIVTAIDLLTIEQIPNVTIFKGDFYDDEEKLGNEFDIVMSDMAPNTTGSKMADHLQIIALVEAAYNFALEKLNKGGVFISKIFQGGETEKLVLNMRKNFETVKYVKPESSRQGSKEIFVVILRLKSS